MVYKTTSGSFLLCMVYFSFFIKFGYCCIVYFEDKNQVVTKRSLNLFFFVLKKVFIK